MTNPYVTLAWVPASLEGFCNGCTKRSAAVARLGLRSCSVRLCPDCLEVVKGKLPAMEPKVVKPRKQTADKEPVTNNTPEQHAQLLKLLGGIGSPTELEEVLLKIGDRTTAVGSTISVSYSHSAAYWRTARWAVYKLVAELAEVRKDG